MHARSRVVGGGHNYIKKQKRKSWERRRGKRERVIGKRVKEVGSTVLGEGFLVLWSLGL